MEIARLPLINVYPIREQELMPIDRHLAQRDSWDLPPLAQANTLQELAEIVMGRITTYPTLRIMFFLSWKLTRNVLKSMPEFSKVPHIHDYRNQVSIDDQNVIQEIKQYGVLLLQVKYFSIEEHGL